MQFLYLKYFGRRLRLSKQALFQTLPRKTTFSYNFKSVVSSILPGHFILPKSAFFPSLIPKTPLKCVAQTIFLHQVEAELYDEHPNKWCFQVNKTAEKSSREAEEQTCHLRARRKKIRKSATRERASAGGERDGPGRISSSTQPLYSCATSTCPSEP